MSYTFPIGKDPRRPETILLIVAALYTLIKKK
jgi:hypothetical protein